MTTADESHSPFETRLPRQPGFFVATTRGGITNQKPGFLKKPGFFSCLPSQMS